MKGKQKTGRLKQRSWVVVNVDGKSFAVKVMHLAGMNQTSFMARRRKKDQMEIYCGWQCVKVTKDPKTIKKLQTSYYA